MKNIGIPFEETFEDHKNLVEELDNMDQDVTSWEAQFLDSMLRASHFTEKQVEVLKKMQNKYL